MSGAQVTVENLSWAPGRHTSTLLQGVTFDVAAGRVLGVVGANGAGKTTLLRLLYRFHYPTTGSVKIGGRDIWSLSARDAAKCVAAVLQEQPSDFALTVREIVALGRTPHRRGFGGSAGARDQRIIDRVLSQLDLGHMSHRSLATLSGGERQRVMVARALAQEPRLLILDEPTNHLDIRHQLEVLELIRNLPLTIITSLHDLNLASEVCDEVLLLHSGHQLGFGSPADVLSEAAVAAAFQVSARSEQLTPSNRIHLTFHLQNQGSPL